jgi:uncharacterized membrane protein YeaQ/YmgE (transglycosylase-associated protein family)
LSSDIKLYQTNKLIFLTNKLIVMSGIIGAIIVGLIAGFLAGKIMRGGGFGLVLNLLLGLVGGAVGGWMFNLLGISMSSEWIGQIITGVVGAVVVLWIASLFKK